MTRWCAALWLLVLWIALWGQVTAANVLSGVVVTALVLAVVPLGRPARSVPVRPLRAIGFAGWFLVQLVIATAIVAREVLTPRERIRTGIIAVPLVGSSRGLATFIANAISLTPGTLTVEVTDDPLTLYVHVLHLHDLGRVHRDIRRLEVKAVRAFGTAEAIAGLEVDDIREGEAPS